MYRYMCTHLCTCMCVNVHAYVYVCFLCACLCVCVYMSACVCQQTRMLREKIKKNQVSVLEAVAAPPFRRSNACVSVFFGFFCVLEVVAAPHS
jgi:hypothetical protein